MLPVPTDDTLCCAVCELCGRPAGAVGNGFPSTSVGEDGDPDAAVEYPAAKTSGATPSSCKSIVILLGGTGKMDEEAL